MEWRLVGSRKWHGLTGRTFLADIQRRINGKRDSFAQLKNKCWFEKSMILIK